MISTNDTPAISVDSVTKLYRTVTAVNSISFSIRQGSITGILGGNGAGKTTTIGMILGLILPTSGAIRVLGHDISVERHKVLHRMNFESPYVALPGRLTSRQNLRVFGRLYGVANVEARIADLAAELDLTEFLDRESGKLSAGQKTRVALAKALVNSPEVLLLDEPTASLDPDTGDWIRSRLEAYSQTRGATILLASHNMPVPHSRTCFSMWCAAAVAPTRSPNCRERAGYAHPTTGLQVDFGGADRCNRASPFLSASHLLAPPSRAHVLAARSNVDVGVPADLASPATRHRSYGGRRADRGDSALGRAHSRSVGGVDFLP